MKNVITKEVILYLNAILQNGRKVQIEYDKKTDEVKILDLRLKKIKVD